MLIRIGILAIFAAGAVLLELPDHALIFTLLAAVFIDGGRRR